MFNTLENDMLWKPILVEESDKNFAPGTFGCHEAFDRASMLRDMVGKLADHKAIKQNILWSNLANEAYKALSDLYQAIGQEHDK